MDGEFTTTTAVSMVTVVQRAVEGRASSLEGLEGEEAVLRCLGASRGEVCRWSSPYGQQFSLVAGEYAERGRLLVEEDCGLRWVPPGWLTNMASRGTNVKETLCANSLCWHIDWAQLNWSQLTARSHLGIEEACAWSIGLQKSSNSKLKCQGLMVIHNQT